jgi:2-polyprenyl-3-methyl-5-hydroxy-6-metoxy-1,4-benzoquinol methylase
VSDALDVHLPPLVCPEDGASLTAADGSVVCPHGHRFEVRGGVPRIVQSASAYTDAFGEQWNHYRRTQLDSYTGTAITRDRLRRCLGDTAWASLQRRPPVQVLETGCGAGRFTEILLASAAQVTSTDLSSAVDANAANCPISPRHRVVQCDIYRLPFASHSFDIVICLGVLQHTPDPEAAIARLYAQVKPGGWLVIDHYTQSLSQYTKITANLLRPLLKRLPPRRGTAATEALTRLFFPLHRLAKHHKVLQMAVSRVSPLLTYYHAYPQLDDRLQYEWALLDTHDSLTDYYKHFRTPRQIGAALAALGAEELWVARGGNGVEARCRRPLQK